MSDILKNLPKFIGRQKERVRVNGLSDSELMSETSPEEEKKKKKSKEMIKRTKRMTSSALASLPSLQDNTSELIKQIGVLSGSSNN